MKYYPLHKSAEEVIQAIGFVPSSPRGWEKPVDEYSKKCHKRGDRLHGFTHAGYVDIHYDRCEGRKHITKAFHQFVKIQMELCAKVDTPPPALNPQVYELVEVGDGMYTTAPPNSPFIALIIRILSNHHGDR